MTDPRGLSTAEAAQRLAEWGANEPVPRRRQHAVIRLLLLFANPLILILLTAAIVSAFLRQPTNALIIIGIVILGTAIGFVQTQQSERAAARLRSMVAPTATVRRDGAWQEMAVRDLVPGDVVRLSAGDLVPADARLLAARDLYVQESLLTGEAMPVAKEAQLPGSARAGDRTGAVYLGTSVVSGMATVEVTATGPRTAFGAIAERLALHPPETEFERGVRRFSLLILRVVFFLVLFILLISLTLRHDPLESLLFAVALAVGLTPEFLPMIMSVTLAKGALRMAQKQVIVRHLPAIQNLGSIDVLCSDKTGTLTAGVMRFEGAVDPAGVPSRRPLVLAWINSRFETGIRSPLDTAILALEDVATEGCEKLDEIPFDFERRRLSVVVDRPSAGGRERLLITKGAPESIFTVATGGDRDGAVVPFDEAALERSRAVFRDLSAAGYRVLAVAHRRVDVQVAYGSADERDMVFDGFLAFADPVHVDAAHAVAALRRDGVAVKVVTGDNELVTRHVCAQVGLDASTIVLGEEIAGLTDGALGHVAEQASVFARVSPVQKDRIIRALRQRGHVVGFLGDGINDAPSLHAADVGISVAGAADVAREAAAIILVRQSLGVLHRGIIEGRRASGNMMKYLLMGTSSNFGNMLSMAAASVFLPFLPMLPTQILLNNFLYDLAQVTIPTDTVDRPYLQRPQRWDMRLVRDFMLFIGPISSLYDFLTFYVLLAVFHAGQGAFHTGWFVESLATQTLVLFVIRTMGVPWRSRPSRALTLTTIGVVGIALVLPASPLAGLLGFVPLPGHYYGFVGLATITYLGLVELAKRRLVSSRMGTV
ncbi:MAG: magnesium-translocating P-type ATPase [Acidobacteriota bacterium]|nr:magnesium-translocating P-type ATPase [Acidobacteriota bacterium]